jgi:methylglutaconyl-CoA hydratase
MRVSERAASVNYQNLEIETAGGVATVWMNRPDRHNAFDEALIAELTAAFAALDVDPEVRVVVLAGRGKSFSAGADLNWMRKAAGYTVEENLRDARSLAAMLKTIDGIGKPTLARVHGAALGGGTGLTTACDIAIASTQAVFATTEVRFGIVPAAISPYVIRAIGPRMASRYFLTAERFDAQEAHRIGMVHEVVAPEALDARIAAITDSLLTGGPKAQGVAKRLIRDVAGRSIDDAVIEYTAQCIGNLRATPEARDGVGAFLDKRKPDWLRH